MFIENCQISLIISTWSLCMVHNWIYSINCYTFYASLDHHNDVQVNIIRTSNEFDYIFVLTITTWREKKTNIRQE